MSRCVSRCSSDGTNLPFRILLKLQLGLISISGVGCVKPKVPLPDYDMISEDRIAEKKTLAKVVDFVPLGALSGPGAPDPDLAHSQFNLDSGRTVYWWTCWDIEIENVNISYCFKHV